MTAPLKIDCLGLFQASLWGNPLAGFESNKVRALLAYLAVEVDKPHGRDSLAGLLWPDWPQESALGNLRYALSNLRKVIGDHDARPPFLLISRETLQFNPASNYWLDVATFQQLVARSKWPIAAEQDVQSSISDLQSAIHLYRGSFLEGFSIGDSAAFEEWILLKREQLSRLMLKGLRCLAQYHEEQGEYEQALSYAWRQVELEPWLEEAHQQLMCLLTLNDQRSAALAQYENCRRLLAKELGVEPARETTQLYEQIRDGLLSEATRETGKRLGERLTHPSYPLPPVPGGPPFKGLEYFDEVDADRFFGRELLTARLVGQMSQMHSSSTEAMAGGGWRFLAVVGASGSGKSSVMRAGLIPALKRGEPLADGTLTPEGSNRWKVYVITPTVHPLEALAASLTSGAESVTATANLMDDLARDPRSLHLYAQRLLANLAPHPSPVIGKRDGGEGYLLLVIDQFEELFTLCRDECERTAFINNILSAAGVVYANPNDEGKEESTYAGRTIVVIALRADFYVHCAQYPRLRQALCARQEYIGSMDAGELRRAIEGPARQGSWEFEPGLVDLILRDVGDEPGGLPLLSHALLETWQRRSGRTLTLQGYAEAGGVHEAIARTAEMVFSHFIPEEKAIARFIFLRLTELGEGTQDTRRRAALDELISKPEEALLVQDVLRRLADARLVTLAEGTAEVAHEALIREWPALREWLDEDREGLHLHRHLTETARAWQEMDRDPGELYRGARLAQAMEWTELSGHLDEFNALEREFLLASQELARRDAAEHEDQRQRELESAQRLADAERQRAETEKQRAEEQTRAAAWLRRRAVYLASALLLAMIMASVAIFFWGRASSMAKRNADLAVQNAASAALAQTQQVVAQAANTQAVAEAATRATAQAEVVIQRDQAMKNAQIAFSRQLTAAALNNLSADPERSILLTLQAVSVSHSAGVPVSFELQDVLHRAVQASRAQLTLTAHAGAIWGLAFSPDGKTLATASADHTVKVWDIAQALYPSTSSTTDAGGKKIQAILSLAGHTDDVEDVAYSPDGKYLATASDDKTAMVWDASTGRVLLTLTGHSGSVYAVAFSPDGRWVATASEDGTTRVWDVGDGSKAGQTLLILPDQGGLIAFSPDGKLLATASVDGTAKVWDLETGLELLTLPFEANGLAFSPDGTHLAATGMESTKVWEVSTGEELLTLCCHTALVREAAFSPDGMRLATAGQDGVAKVWDAQTGEVLMTLSGHLGAVDAVAFSPGCVNPPEAPFAWCGRYLATASRDGTAKIWDVSPAGSREVLTATGMTGGYSPEETRLYILDLSVPDAAKVHVWEVDPGSELVELSVYSLPLLPAPIVAGNFSPDMKRGVVASLDGSVLVWDLTNAEQVLSYIVPIANESILGVAFGSGGVRLATGSEENTIKIWDVKTGREVLTLPTPAWTIAFSPDGSRLATGGEDGVVSVWDASTGQLVRTLTDHNLPINAMVFSPDGKRLATGGMDSMVKVWDLEDVQMLFDLAGHTSSVTSLAFSPDGTHLVSGELGGIAILWDVNLDNPTVGQNLLNFNNLGDVVNFIFFSQDGTRLGTGSYSNQNVRIYSLAIEDLMALAQSRLTRSFTLDECRKYLYQDTCP